MPQSSEVCALIACSHKKAKKVSRAVDLYLGTRFKLSLEYTKKVLHTRSFLILSAKHGLIPPRRYIDPYDQSLADMTIIERKEWAANILYMIETTILNRSGSPPKQFVVLAEDLYAEHLHAAGLKASYPLRDMDEEQQLAFLRDALEKVQK